MSKQVPHEVALVVDPEFREGLALLGSRMPLWVVNTPQNSIIASRFLSKRQGTQDGPDVTVFDVDPTQTPEDWACDIIKNIDLHHGHYSHDPPFSVMEVYGVDPTPRLRKELLGIGFNRLVEAPKH